MPIIGVLRPAMRGNMSNPSRWPILREIIAQPSHGNVVPHGGFAQFVSDTQTRHAKRTIASRQSRDAVSALATGRVALAVEEPSQGRRSLSRFPASGPQGFWPVELNIQVGSK